MGDMDVRLLGIFAVIGVIVALILRARLRPVKRTPETRAAARRFAAMYKGNPTGTGSAGGAGADLDGDE